MSERNGPYYLPDIVGSQRGEEGSGPFGHLSSIENVAFWGPDWGVSRVAVLFMIFGFYCVAAYVFMPHFFKLVFSWILATAPIWLCFLLPYAWWQNWKWYTFTRHFTQRKTALLEVHMPHEIHKSPAAMEHVLSELWYTSGQTTVIDRYWSGSRRPWSSLEICSFGGHVHFYVWCFEELKPLIELNLYAQYPEIEIEEVEDYATKFVYDPSKMDVFGNHMIYLEDPVLPIRTYHDMELEEVHEPEHIVDPLAQVLETLSAMKNTEQGWIQILFQSMSEGGQAAFNKQAHHTIEKLRLEGALFGPHTVLTETQQRIARARPTWLQTEQMHSIERQMNKRMFEVGIRICYIANFEDYRGSMRNALRWIFMPYYGQWQNRLRPKRWHGDFDYDWQDFKGIRWRLTSRRLFDAWRRRSYFHWPYIFPALPMSTEAIASLWHPPSSGIATPGLERLHAKKAEPPHNLPR